MASIALDGVGKSFGATTVLSELSLEVRDGEFLSLVGPSGCGKSTLLRIIAGLEDLTSGSICIDEREVNAVRASERNLAMVFQSYALYPHLTVRENMATPLRLRDSTWHARLPVVRRAMPAYRALSQRIDGQVMQVAQTLKIEHLLDRKPGQLSGGQRQRAALGRAMVRKPVAFLMDEPLSNLDAALRVHMRAELSQLHRALQTTFVYVTHDQAEALTMSDRIAVMLDGRIVQLGTPDEVYQRPATREVARFIGSPAINLVPIDLPGTDIRPLDALDDWRGRVRELGVRAENLRLSGTWDNADDCIQWPVRVIHRENLGAEGYVHGVVPGTEVTLVIRVAHQELSRLQPGDELRVSCDIGHLHLFDAEGVRITCCESDNAVTGNNMPGPTTRTGESHDSSSRDNRAAA